MNSSPFFRRPSPPGFARTRFLVCGAGLFRLCDNIHVYIPAVIKGFQLFKGWYGKEISVRQKQGIAKSKGSQVSVLHHLNYMGGG